MRVTWTAAALTAALGFTAVAGASADVAGAADASTARAATTRPISAAAPTVGLPSVPDPTKTLDVLGALGGVLKLVTGLVATAVPTSGVPDPAALQKQLADLQAAVKDLLAKLPAPPVLPTPPVSAIPGSTDPSTVPQGLVPVPVPLPVSPADALAKVQKDAGDLVAAATAAKPDPAAVQKVIAPLSTDTVGATTATATSLVTG